ncbi:unnamed protein product [Lymnaea stagnalis]|uniref:Peptidase M12B domain-containing protein n=1 Tax=Lymnaea stagnalis TaxID=6523 RepID=A0AAV2I5C2_LYMST
MHSRMAAILQVCVLVGMLLNVMGDVITVRLPHVTMDFNGNCRFPEVLNIDLIRHLPPYENWSFRLQHNGATTSSSHAYFIKRDEVKGIHLQRVDLENGDFQSVQGYHNNHMGAAFTVKCSPKMAIGEQVYLLEGSIFLDGKKYTIAPSASPYHGVEVSQDGVSFQYNMTEAVEHSAADAAAKDVPQGYTPSSSYESMKFESTQHRRVKRQTKVYNIDILVFIDVSMYRRWLPKGDNNRTTTASLINNYLANIFSSINMRLDTLDLKGTRLKAQLLSPLISETDDTSPWNANLLDTSGSSITVEASALLSAFKDYLKSSQFAFDHAMLLTSYDIYGGNDQGIRFNITKGLAYVGTMCSRSNGQSSSVIEDKGAYQSEGVIAHELGHSLGSKHDGQDNICTSSSRYLMSDSTYKSTNDTLLNPWKFSECSSAAILSKLQELEKTNYLTDCLNPKSGSEVNTIGTTLADEQCKMFYGNTSYVCRGSNLPPFSTICSEFSCRAPGLSSCTILIAATGTCCGRNKKCIQGSCEATTSSECLIDAVCPLGDQPGIVKNNMTCSQLSSTECYLEDMQIRCCDTCRKWKATFNSNACPYGNKRYNCSTSLCGSTTLDNIDYNFYCCDTCPPGTPTPQCFNTTVKVNGCGSCEQVFLEKSASLCYDKSFHANYCINECESHRNKESSDCPWGDRKNCSLTFEKVSPGYVCSSDLRYNCCASCDRVATTTSLSTTTTPTTTRSTLATSTITRPTTRTSTSTAKAASKPFGGNASNMLKLCHFLMVLTSLPLLFIHC